MPFTGRDKALTVCHRAWRKYAPFRPGAGPQPELLLLLIHVDYRRLGGLVPLTCSLMSASCASRSGCCVPPSGLAVACTLNPAVRSSRPTVGAETGWPAPSGRWPNALRLRRPAQRRHRIVPRVRNDQPEQGRHQLRTVRGDRLTPSAGLGCCRASGCRRPITVGRRCSRAGESPGPMPSSWRSLVLGPSFPPLCWRCSKGV